MKKKIGFLFLLGLLSLPSKSALANVAPADVAARFEKLEALVIKLQNQLVEQDEKYQEEIESLRKEIEIKGPQEKSVYIPSAQSEMPKWLDGLKMGGDMRLRYEGFERNEATRDRNRFRYRLRWKIEKSLNEDFDMGFRLVSGSSTDPTSTNQTFTGDFTYKNIFIDQAYGKYHPSFLKEHVPHLKKGEMGEGKVENPFLQTSSGLVWDADVMPEGVYESLEFGFFDEKLNPFVNLGQFVLQENATTPDAELYGFQGGIRWNVPGFDKESDVKMTNTVAYYDFSDFARNSNFTVSGVSLANGNTPLGSTNLAAGDFNILQIYNELGFKVKGFPIKLFGDFATNLDDGTPDPDGRNVGYEYGIKVGSAKKKGDWEASYYYAYIEPNAVVGAFADSDFGGGFADKRGSAVKLGYKLTDTLKVAASASFTNNVVGADDELRRFQTDLEWIF